jgi:hypothetical protein
LRAELFGDNGIVRLVGHLGIRHSRSSYAGTRPANMLV